MINMSESAQEVLELLWAAVEEQGELGLEIEQASLGGAHSEGIQDLLRQGLAERQNGTVMLTAPGYTEAEQAVRRHRLAERLMVDVLVTEDAQVDARACRFEHVLTDGVEESICTLLGHPRFCPHGRPIPMGRCCEEMQTSVIPLIAPLRDLSPEQHGEIAYIRMDKPKRLQKLMAMGVLPGVGIRLQRRFPSFVFEIGRSQFAVDEEIAGDIYVRISRSSHR